MRKNPVDEKFEEILLLNVKRQPELARTNTRILISDLIKNPSLINGMNMSGEFGNFLSNKLDDFQNIDEIQFISELSFFMITKVLKKEIHPFNLYDRIVVMYNAEDFLIDTIKQANDLHYKPLRRESSLHAIKWQAEEILLKMRYHDLFNENKFYRDGSNDDSFNGQEFLRISKMIENGKFETTKINFANEGGELINKCYEYIAEEYSFEI